MAEQILTRRIISAAALFVNVSSKMRSAEFLFQQISHAISERARFAGTRAGDDQRRRAAR